MRHLAECRLQFGLVPAHCTKCNSAPLEFRSDCPADGAGRAEDSCFLDDGHFVVDEPSVYTATELRDALSLNLGARPGALARLAPARWAESIPPTIAAWAATLL